MAFFLSIFQLDKANTLNFNENSFLRFIYILTNRLIVIEIRLNIFKCRVLFLFLSFLLGKKENKKASPDSILSFSFSKLNFDRMISLVPHELSDLSKALLWKKKDCLQGHSSVLRTDLCKICFQYEDSFIIVFLIRLPCTNWLALWKIKF